MNLLLFFPPTGPMLLDQCGHVDGRTQASGAASLCPLCQHPAASRFAAPCPSLFFSFLVQPVCLYNQGGLVDQRTQASGAA